MCVCKAGKMLDFLDVDSGLRLFSRMGVVIGMLLLEVLRFAMVSVLVSCGCFLFGVSYVVGIFFGFLN